MKKRSIFSMMLGLALLMALSINVQAQNCNRPCPQAKNCAQSCVQAPNCKRADMPREELAQVQAKHMAVDLGLDEAATRRFVEAYCRCQKEIWNLRPQYGKERKKPLASAMEEEIGKELQDRFAHSRKILDIREKYYKEYSQFLTQKQIKQIYQREKKMMNCLSARKKNAKKR